MKARDVLKQALLIDQQRGSEEDVATSIKNLGYASWNLGDYAIAQRHLENALAIFERTQGLQGSDVTNIQTDLAELAGIIAAPSQEIEELNPWCFLTQDDCARLSACSSLAIPYLPDAGGDSAQPH